MTALPGERPRRRVLWSFIALVSAVTVLVPLLGAAALHYLHHFQYRALQYRRPVSMLRIDAPGGLVTVSPGPPGQVRIQRQLSWEAGQPPQVRQVWAGRTLTVSAQSCGGKWGWVRRCGVQLGIQVPAGVSVRAVMTGGVFTALRLTGPEHVSLTAGEADFVAVGGPVWAWAASGTVNLTGVRGPVRVRAGPGQISAAGLRSPHVDAAVTGGYLSLQFATSPRWVSAAATSGTVMVSVPPGSRYRVTGSTGSGTRDIALALLSSTSPRLIRLSVTSGEARVGYGPPAPFQPALPTPQPPPPHSAG